MKTGHGSGNPSARWKERSSCRGERQRSSTRFDLGRARKTVETEQKGGWIALRSTGLLGCTGSFCSFFLFAFFAFGPGLLLFFFPPVAAQRAPNATFPRKRDGIHRKSEPTDASETILAAALTQSRAAQPPPDPLFYAPRFVWPLRTSTATVSELLARRAAELLQLCPRYLRSLRVTEGQRAPRARGTNTLQHRPRSRSGLGTVVLSPRQESCFWHRRKRGKKPADLKSRDQYE